MSDDVAASDTSKRAILVSILLHEDSQYRDEINRHESRLISVGLTYLSGVVAAVAWSASQLSTLLGDKTDVPLQEVWSRAMDGLLAGRFFYVVVGVPIITSILFFIVARAWASIYERILLLRAVGRDAAAVAEGLQLHTDIQVLRFSRGLFSTRLRPWAEVPLAIYWGLMVALLVLSTLIWTYASAWTRPEASGLRRLYWSVASGGTGLSIACMLTIVYTYYGHWRNLKKTGSGPGATSDVDVISDEHAERRDEEED